MKRSLVAALVVMVGGVLARGTSGQDTATAPPPSAGTRVGLVDIGQIFKNHARFKQQLEALKQDVVAYENQVKEDRQAVAKQREKLVELSQGTQDYKQLEQQVAHRISDLQVRDQLKKKEIMEREAKAYYDTYNEIVEEVGRVAAHFGVSLVLRFDSDKIDPNDRGAVLAGVNRAIVYQSRLDLTPNVLAAFTSSGATSAATPRTTTRPATAAPAAPPPAQPALRQAARPAAAVPANGGRPK